MHHHREPGSRYSVLLDHDLPFAIFYTFVVLSSQAPNCHEEPTSFVQSRLLSLPPRFQPCVLAPWGSRYPFILLLLSASIAISRLLAMGCVWWCQSWIRLNTSTTFFTTESAFLPHSLPGCCPAGYFGSYSSWPGALPCQAEH